MAKKLMAILLATLMLFSMAACSTNIGLTMNVGTGDEIKVKLDTSDDHSMKWDDDDNVLNVKADGDTILEMIWDDEDHMAEYCEAATGYVNVKEFDIRDDVVYSVFVANDDEDEIHYIVGWIIGSDTGFIIEGTDSKRETMRAFDALTFEVKDTDQDDEDYYLECVEIENVEPGDGGDIIEPDDDKRPVDDDHDEEDRNDAEKETKPQEDDEDEETQPQEDEKKDNDSDETSSISADWKDFEFSIDGHKFSLPCSYKEIKDATGYHLKSSEEKSWLEPNYYTTGTLRDSDGELVCYVSVMNVTNEDQAVADGTLVMVSQTDDLREYGHVVEFAGGLKAGSKTSTDELVALFGDYNDIYEYRIDEDDDPSWVKYETDTYTWSLDKNWDNYDFIEIEMNIHSGTIEEIGIDAMGIAND